MKNDSLELLREEVGKLIGEFFRSIGLREEIEVLIYSNKNKNSYVTNEETIEFNTYKTDELLRNYSPGINVILHEATMQIIEVLEAYNEKFKGDQATTDNLSEFKIDFYKLMQGQKNSRGSKYEIRYLIYMMYLYKDEEKHKKTIQRLIRSYFIRENRETVSENLVFGSYVADYPKIMNDNIIDFARQISETQYLYTNEKNELRIKEQRVIENEENIDYLKFVGKLDVDHLFKKKISNIKNTESVKHNLEFGDGISELDIEEVTRIWESKLDITEELKFSFKEIVDFVTIYNCYMEGKIDYGKEDSPSEISDLLHLFEKDFSQNLREIDKIKKRSINKYCKKFNAEKLEIELNKDLLNESYSKKTLYKNIRDEFKTGKKSYDLLKFIKMSGYCVLIKDNDYLIKSNGKRLVDLEHKYIDESVSGEKRFFISISNRGMRSKVDKAYEKTISLHFKEEIRILIDFLVVIEIISFILTDYIIALKEVKLTKKEEDELRDLCHFILKKTFFLSNTEEYFAYQLIYTEFMMEFFKLAKLNESFGSLENLDNLVEKLVDEMKKNYKLLEKNSSYESINLENSISLIRKNLEESKDLNTNLIEYSDYVKQMKDNKELVLPWFISTIKNQLPKHR